MGDPVLVVRAVGDAWNDPGVIDGEPIIAVPPGPRCLDCGHQACPCCFVWCDVILDDGELCCDGTCRYREGELDAWATQLEKVLPRELGFILRASEGPFR